MLVQTSWFTNEGAQDEFALYRYFVRLSAAINLVLEFSTLVAV